MKVVVPVSVSVSVFTKEIRVWSDRPGDFTPRIDLSSRGNDSYVDDVLWKKWVTGRRFRVHGSTEESNEYLPGPALQPVETFGRSKCSRSTTGDLITIGQGLVVEFNDMLC